MSIFDLGGVEERVPNVAILPEMEQDRYFVPGMIHGGDYLIRVYLDREEEDERFFVDYITRSLVKEAHEKDPTDGDVFEDYIMSECENFVNYNGDANFNTLVQSWFKTIPLSNSDLVEWANGPKNQYPEEPFENRLVRFSDIDEIESVEYGVLQPDGNIICLCCGSNFELDSYWIHKYCSWSELSSPERAAKMLLEYVKTTENQKYEF